LYSFVVASVLCFPSALWVCEKVASPVICYMRQYWQPKRYFY